MLIAPCLETTLVVEDDTIEPLLEPLLGFGLGYLVADTNLAGSDLSPGDTSTRSSENNVEVHTVDTSTWVVLDTKIDVFLDTEAKVTSLREVSTLELVLLYLKTLLEDLLGLLTANSAVAGNLFIPTNVERPDGVSSLREDRLLISQRFEDTGGLGESITTFTNTDTDNKLLNLNLSHRVSAFVLRSLLGHLGKSLSDQGERKF